MSKIKEYSGKIAYIGIDVHKNTHSVAAICEGFLGSGTSGNLEAPLEHYKRSLDFSNLAPVPNPVAPRA